MQGQIKFMKEVVPWLDQEDVIEKYAWCLDCDMPGIFCGIVVVGTGGEPWGTVGMWMLSLLLLKRSGRVEAQPVGKRLIGFSMIDRGSVTSPTNGRMASQILIQMQVWCLGISVRNSATTSRREGGREVNMIRV